MGTYQIYIPSAEGYRVFLENIKIKSGGKYKGEEDFLAEFSHNYQNPERVKDLVYRLNNKYKTRISHRVLDEIIEFILQLHLEDELDLDGYNLVKKLKCAHSKKRKDDEKVEYLSFASKYCHHCRPDKYPAYDSINVRVFNILFGYKDNRIYNEYVKCFKAFCSVLGFENLENNTGFYIDKYIQAIGNRDDNLLFT